MKESWSSERFNPYGEGGSNPIHSDEEVEAIADKFEKWLKNEDNIWLKDFAISCDIPMYNFHRFAKRNEKFKRVYEKSKEIQESRLFQGGLKNKYHAQLVKFALVNFHNWQDKKQLDISSKEDPLSVIYNKINGTSKDLVKDGD